MSTENKAGFYVAGEGSGGHHGPRGGGSLRAYLLYGVPRTEVKVLYPRDTDLFDPILGHFGLLRYFDPRERHTIYIDRYPPEAQVPDRDQNATPIPATPELHRVFDHYLLLYRANEDAYIQSTWSAWDLAMTIAGVTEEDYPPEPEVNSYVGPPNTELQAIWDDYYRKREPVDKRIWDLFVQPKSLTLTRVEGIDPILLGIPLTPPVLRETH